MFLAIIEGINYFTAPGIILIQAYLSTNRNYNNLAALVEQEAPTSITHLTTHDTHFNHQSSVPHPPYFFIILIFYPSGQVK